MRSGPGALRWRCPARTCASTRAASKASSASPTRCGTRPGWSWTSSARTRWPCRRQTPTWISSTAGFSRARRGIEDFAPQVAINGIYDFAWHDFCDWYLEAIKPRLRDGDPAARAVSLNVLDVLFRLLHPFMPFVTEELWHRLPGDRDFVMRQPWPAGDSRFSDPDAEARVDKLIALVEEIRRARQAAAAPSRGGRLKLEQPWEPGSAALAADLAAVALVEELAAQGIALTEVAARVEFPALGVEPDTQTATRERLLRELQRSQAKLADEDFVAKAPQSVVDRERQRAADVKEALERLDGARVP